MLVALIDLERGSYYFSNEKPITNNPLNAGFFMSMESLTHTVILLGSAASVVGILVCLCALNLINLTKNRKKL